MKHLPKLKVHWGIAVALLLVSGVPALWFTKFFLRDAYQLFRAQSWPARDVVVKTAAEDTLPEPGQGHGPGALFERIEYSFESGGKQYLSRRYGPFQRWNFGKNAPQFTEGRTVAAYVNPADLYESVLDIRVREGFWLVLSLTLLSLVWSLWALLSVFRSTRFIRAFLGHLLLLLPAGILAGTLVASEVDRTTDWWFAVGGFMTAIALVGVSVILSLWSRRAFLLAGIGLVAGFVSIFVGVAMRE
jgi:hypothetical protein